MRITKYKVEMDNDRKNVLVKEASMNYGACSQLDSTEKVVKMLNDCFHMDRLSEEHTYLLSLSNKGAVQGVFEVSHGGIDFSSASPREIFVRLLLTNAAQFILAHNHPSGDTTPSRDDINVTKEIKKSADLMDVRFLDHIIIGSTTYKSLRDVITGN